MMQRVKNSEKCKDTATFYKFNEKKYIYEAILGNSIFFFKYTMCDKWSAHENPSVLSRLLNTKNQPPYINKTNKRENATFLIFMQNKCLPKKSWTRCSIQKHISHFTNNNQDNYL